MNNQDEVRKIKNNTVYAPWLDKEIDWKEHLHNEIHLLVARVQGTEDLGEQIEHGNDFVGRLTELVEAILAKKREEIEKLQKNIQPLYKFGDVVIDSKRTQDGTILGQMKAYLEALSILS